MHKLYDSDTFVVVHEVLDEGSAIQPRDQRHGFEIVDKRTNKEVYLVDDWADAFRKHLAMWRAITPSQDEVEEILDNYSALAQIPLMMH